MKIALSQLNYHIGNFKSNSDKIISEIQNAKHNNVDLIIFSELSVCGYTPLDLLEREDFVVSTLRTIEEISLHCENITAIIGSPTINKESKGKKLFNSAIVIENKKMKNIINKTLLPTYDIFDEYRYFEPNKEFKLVEINGNKIALTICEDLWDEQEIRTNFDRQMLYKTSPMDSLSKLNPDYIINIASSPFSYDQSNTRKNILINTAKKYNLPVVYVNQTGANTEQIFDGGSLIINSNGEIVKELKYFKEDTCYFNTENFKKQDIATLTEYSKIAKIYDALVLGIKDYFSKMNFKKATLGLSGGIDSAVVLALAEKAIGAENIDVLLMPSQYSSQHSIDDAIQLAEKLNVKYNIIPIKDIFDEFNKSLHESFIGTSEDVTEENIQARARGVLLMAYSNKKGNILLNTSNKSEAAVGYTTLYGDMNGGLSVIGDVYKSDVFALARYINKDEEIIPINTIEKPPSAELRFDQKDSDSLPEYEILDGILYNYIELKMSVKAIEEAGYDKETIIKITKLVNANEYKRFQSPPILRISSKAFGFGRRIPLVAKYF